MWKYGVGLDLITLDTTAGMLVLAVRIVLAGILGGLENKTRGPYEGSVCYSLLVELVSGRTVSEEADVCDMGRRTCRTVPTERR